MTFSELNIHPRLLDAIAQSGYTEPTAIQEESIPHILNGNDMLGSAQTGTGKTAAFALPIIQRLQDSTNAGQKKQARALILAPTRELAVQIKDSFTMYAKYSSIKTTTVYGGVPKRRQIQAIKRGVDVIIATPGRLLDLMNMNILKLDTIEYYVLDEADRMLDMGFIDDVKAITSAITSAHQTMLFSATLPKAITDLSKALLVNPVRVEVAKDNTPLETIHQSIYYIKNTDKTALLGELLTQDTVTSALVFVRTKQGANRLTKVLNEMGIKADAIHGNKTQAQRQQSLNNFKQKKTKILVATDVASRGIDIDALSHVINYDLPETPETYLHRIGRTARAGRLGSSISFCSPEERHLVKSIQNHISMKIPVESHPRFKQPKGEEKRVNPYQSSQKIVEQPWKKHKKSKHHRNRTKQTKSYKKYQRVHAA